MRVYEEIIKDNIEYDILKQNMPFDHDRSEMKSLIIMLETVCTPEKDNPYCRGRLPGGACEGKVYEAGQRAYPFCP